MADNKWLYGFEREWTPGMLEALRKDSEIAMPVFEKACAKGAPSTSQTDILSTFKVADLKAIAQMVGTPKLGKNKTETIELIEAATADAATLANAVRTAALGQSQRLGPLVHATAMAGGLLEIDPASGWANFLRDDLTWPVRVYRDGDCFVSALPEAYRDVVRDPDLSYFVSYQVLGDVNAVLDLYGAYGRDDLVSTLCAARPHFDRELLAGAVDALDESGHLTQIVGEDEPLFVGPMGDWMLEGTDYATFDTFIGNVEQARAGMAPADPAPVIAAGSLEALLLSKPEGRALVAWGRDNIPSGSNVAEEMEVWTFESVHLGIVLAQTGVSDDGMRASLEQLTADIPGADVAALQAVMTDFISVVPVWALFGSTVRSQMTASLAGRAKPAPVASAKVGRNDPCPCGSGKKYKKCCGRPGK